MDTYTVSGVKTPFISKDQQCESGWSLSVHKLLFGVCTMSESGTVQFSEAVTEEGVAGC